jgi:hypothetical protein
MERNMLDNVKGQISIKKRKKDKETVLPSNVVLTIFSQFLEDLIL